MERLFHTFQDREIKEMWLAHVSTLNAANQFLDGYLPLYNLCVAVPPAQASDLHRPRPAHRELDRIRCLKTTTMPSPGLPHRAPGGDSTRFTIRSGPSMGWWKSAWMGRGGSRTKVGRSTFTRSRLGP